MASDNYVGNAVSTVEGLLQADLLQADVDGLHLKTTAKETIPTSYKPELDVSNELSADLASQYQQLIGVLRWAVEPG